jgi:hypothetical protein
VQDLEESLLLEPERSDLMQQCARAQSDFAEHKRLQDLQADGAAAAAGAPSAKEQLAACKDMEASVRAFASVDIASSNTADKENSGSFPAGIGRLPQRHDSSKTARKLNSAAAALCAKMKGSSDMRMYFRACGGLTAAANQLHKAVSCASASAAIAPCAELLTEACQLDSNARAISGCSMPKGDAYAGTSGGAARLQSICCTCSTSAEVAVLLQTLSTEAGARVNVAKALCSAHRPGESTGVLVQLLHSAVGMPDLHRAVVLSLLGNCATVPAFQKAFAKNNAQTSCTLAVLSLLQQESNPAALERVALLIGNLAANASLRKALPEAGGFGTELVARAAQMQQSGARGAPAALQACLSCLYTLALEGPIRQQLAADEWYLLLSHLLPATCAIESAVALSAVNIVSRFASAEESYAGMAQHGLLPRLLSVAVESRHTLLQSESQGDAIKVISAVVRAWAAWGGAGHTELLRQNAALQLLVWACSASAISDNCAGNAALCLSYVADAKCESPAACGPGTAMPLTKWSLSLSGAPDNLDGVLVSHPHACKFVHLCKIRARRLDDVCAAAGALQS